MQVRATGRKVWLHGLYIHVASAHDHFLEEVEPLAATPGSWQRALCEEQRLSEPWSTLNMSMPYRHCQNVPKLLEISAGHVWASQLTLQGNTLRDKGASMMGVMVDSGARLHMQGAQLSCR
jgi:hypothetical protein